MTPTQTKPRKKTAPRKKKAEPAIAREVDGVVIPASIAEWRDEADAELRDQMPRSGETPLPDEIAVPGNAVWWLARTGGVAGRVSPICHLCGISLEGPLGFEMVNGFSICKRHVED